MVYLMKRKNECMTDDEYIAFMYMFELRKAKMDNIEKIKLKDRAEYLKIILDSNYDLLRHRLIVI